MKNRNNYSTGQGIISGAIFNISRIISMINQLEVAYCVIITFFFLRAPKKNSEKNIISLFPEINLFFFGMFFYLPK